MTAVYSEERPDRAAQFRLGAATNRAGYVDEPDTWDSIASERRQNEFLAGLDTALDALGTLPPVEQSGAAFDTIDWAEIDHELSVAKPIEFAHTCEQDFARMLDARDIPWRYKPRTFAVEWDDEGNFVDCFTPDFYLPANEMYIALITPGGDMFNAKCRHVKMLRHQHPEIRIALFNGTFGSHMGDNISGTMQR